MVMGGVMVGLPGFGGRGTHRFGVSVVLILVLTSLICNSQHVHNCTDLILTDGTLFIDTDCGVWYLVCDNNTSCLPYDVADDTNVTYTCMKSYQDLDLGLELDLFSDGGSGDETTPWLWSTQLLYTNPTSGTTLVDTSTTASPLTTSRLTSTTSNWTTKGTNEATSNNVTNDEVSGTPETTVQPEQPGTTTSYRTTLDQATETASVLNTSDTTSGISTTTAESTWNASTTWSNLNITEGLTTQGATVTILENTTVVQNVTEIISTDMASTADYTTAFSIPESLDCDRRYNTNMNQQVILRGDITYHNYTDDVNTTWKYAVASFNVNGSLYLGSALRVEVRGQNALRVTSTYGDVIVNATVHLDRRNSSQYVNESSAYADQFLGGFGRFGGPGGAAPNSSDGAGHGGMGGARNPSTLYSQAYLVNDTTHLIGGSAGGLSTDFNGTARAFGGGAIEIIAAGFIYIESQITARGEDGGQWIPEGPDCIRGGGSGGLIRLIADSIYIMDSGSLNVEGGEGSLANNGTSCGGGGAGGVVQLLANESRFSVGSLNVLGGAGFVNGEQGVLSEGSACSNTGGGGGGGSGQGGRGGGGGGGEGGGGGGGEGGGGTDSYSSSESGSRSTVESSGMTEPVQSGSVSPDPVTSYFSGETSQMMATTLKMTTSMATTSEGNTVSTPSTPNQSIAATATITTTATSNVIMASTTKVTSNNTVAKRELTNLITSFSVGTSGSNTSSSRNISSKEAATQLKELENALSNVASSLVHGLAEDEPLKTTITIGDTAVVIDIVPVADFVGTSFPSEDSNSASGDAKISIPTVVLPENATGHMVSVFILHTSPPHLGGNLVENRRSNVSFELNSQVISASVSLANNGTVSFNEPIRIVLRNNQEDSTQDSSLCVFYDFSADNNTGAWSTEGCRASDVNATHVTCSCDHLTNFAILLQINDIEISEKDQLVLQIISQVGIGLSLIFLTVGFIIIAAALKSLHNREAAIIHLNLMGAMIIGHLIFLIGIDKVHNQNLCKAVAMLLHFFYLVTFCWMLMEGVHIYFRATRVFKNTSYQLKIFHVFAWGTPCLIVMITALVNIDFYGTDQACWLSRERGAIWAFAGPVVFVIGMNVIVLVVVLQTFLTIKSINSKSKFEQAKRSTRAAVVLLPLLGITWIFGFLATGSATIFFQYAFALLNSLQGVFICVFHCFTNDDVMKVVKLKYNRSKQQFDAISSQHSMVGRFRSTTGTNKVSAVGRKEAFVEKSKISTTGTDTSVF